RTGGCRSGPGSPVRPRVPGPGQYPNACTTGWWPVHGTSGTGAGGGPITGEAQAGMRERGLPQGTFTEWGPQVPLRCRITRRLLEHCGGGVAERGITPAGAARHHGISWPSAHSAFMEKADALLGDDPEPVARLDIDEHRRGRARWRRDEGTGEYVLVAD